MSEQDKHIPEENNELHISQLVSLLQEREAQRRLAVDMAWEQLNRAESTQEVKFALENIARMSGVYDEYVEQFKQIFPASENE